jgi:cytoskeleton protein RodZ
MTDDSGALDAVSAPAVPPSPPVTAGALLRQSREAAGLHIAALAVAMKVPVAKLEALEADRFDLLPDAVFARALASGVCRALKIDARQVLDKLPQSARPTLKDNERGIDAPFRSPSDGPGPSLLNQLSWPVVVVLGLLMAAVAVYLYPHSRSEPAASVAQEPAPVEHSGQIQVVPSPEAPPAGTVVETPAQQPNQASEPVAAVIAPAAKPPAAPVAAAAKSLAPAVVPPTAVASQPALRSVQLASAPAALARASQPVAQVATVAKPVSAPGASVPAAAASQAQAVPFAANAGTLVLRAKAASWVSVTDARGTSLVNKVLAPGEVAAASGALPLRVTVGKADGTEVLVRGKAFDLAPVSRENVARFEVK